MKPVHILLALCVIAIWGTNFVTLRYAAADFPPWLLLALRHGCAALIMAPFARWMPGRMGRVYLISLSLGVVHFGFMTIALQHLQAGTGAILMQTTVPFAALLAWLAFGDALGWRRAAGMAAAFVGVGLIAGAPSIGGRIDMVAMMLVSAAAFSVANIQIKRLGEFRITALAAWLAILSAPQSALLSLLFEDGQLAALQGARTGGWLAILYMAVVVSFVSHSLWYVVVGRYATNQVMPFTLLVPVVAVAVGVAVLGETMTAAIAAGGVLTVAGVAVIVTRRPDTAAVQPALRARR
jgi:O-acetylserine/cysteine efflux transporter